MTIRETDAYYFNSIQSLHEENTRLLEQAIASNCSTLRNHLHEYRETVAFRRMPHIEKLATVLWQAAWRLTDVDHEKAAELRVHDNVAKIANVMGKWLGIDAMPLQWVTGIAPLNNERKTIIESDVSTVVPSASAAYCIRQIAKCGQTVIDARDPIELEFAAGYLLDATHSIGANLLIDVLLKKAAIRIRRLSVSNGPDAIQHA